MTNTSLVYYPGGFDPNAAGNNIRERLVDNGDGTGVRTSYDEQGNQTSVENLAGLPIPAESEPTLEDQVAELQALLDALLGEGE